MFKNFDTRCHDGELLACRLDELSLAEHVGSSNLPEPEAGFYLELLLELPVYLDGEPFGEVVDVISAGFQDLLAILHEGEEYLVPLQADYVQIGEEGVSIKDAPEGLLEPS